MNSSALHAAAGNLEAAARERLAWAASAKGMAIANLHSQVAQQLQDRAMQVRSWARSAAYHAEQGREYPADVAAQIEAAVKEFLKMAGRA